jgi:hypothetical protein
MPENPLGGGTDGALLVVYPTRGWGAGPGFVAAADRSQQVVAVEQLAHQRPIEEAEAQATRGLGGDGLAAASLKARDGYDRHDASGD